MPDPQHAMASRLTVAGIPRFAEVTPNVYRGGQPGADALKALSEMGVKVVIDLRGGHSKSEDAAVTKLGMQYVSIPSHCPFPTDKPWARFLTVMRENEGKKVFVHCRLGDDRTGIAVATYRISEQGWSPDEAMSEMKEFGFSRMHHVICPGLSSYVQHLPEKLKTDPAFRNLPPTRAPSSK
jgi:protein tyrosine/serine phosphatase